MQYSKNHYIPRFYLKHFTNADNHFFIFDKENNSGALKVFRRSPSQTCYEWDRYTFYSKQGQRNTTLEEKSYGYFDKRHSRIIEHLAESRNPRWNDEIKYGLRHFIPLLYWRSPASDDHFKSKIAEAKTIREFGLEAFDTKNQKVIDDPNQHKELLAEPNFQKSIRMTYAHSMVHNPDSFDINPSHEWRLIYHEEGCIANVTSDNPIVFYRNPDGGGDIMGSQLIPISPTRTLLRLNENYKGAYHNQFMQNLAIVDQAIRYVICSDKEYLMRLIQAYEKIKSSDVLNDLKFDVFGLYD